MPLSDEFTLIKKIQKKIGNLKKGVLFGIGDDCAILAPFKNKLLTTVDCLVENVHFSLKFFSPEDVGYKALAVNLSDIAAMGGKPLYALVSLGLREGIDDRFVLKFYEGLLGLAKKYGVQVVGGNMTRSNQFFADVTVIGESQRPLLRSGAKVGDLVGVSGYLGLAASGLQAMLRKASEEKFPSLFSRQRRPIPRLDAGAALEKNNAVHSLIDISDGFSSELWHLSKTSNVMIEIDESKAVIAPELKHFCKRYKYLPEDFIWNGGEDYELLGTYDAKAERSLKKWMHPVGRVTGKGTGVYRIHKGGRQLVVPAGWNHFER